MSRSVFRKSALFFRTEHRRCSAKRSRFFQQWNSASQPALNWSSTATTSTCSTFRPRHAGHLFRHQRQPRLRRAPQNPHLPGAGTSHARPETAHTGDLPRKGLPQRSDQLPKLLRLPPARRALHRQEGLLRRPQSHHLLLRQTDVRHRCQTPVPPKLFPLH